LTPAPIEDRLDVLDKKEKKNVQPNTWRLGMNNSCVSPPQIIAHVSNSHYDIGLQFGNHDLPYGLNGIVDPLRVVK
jgi:hypothetical protein